MINLALDSIMNDNEMRIDFNGKSYGVNPFSIQKNKEAFLNTVKKMYSDNIDRDGLNALREMVGAYKEEFVKNLITTEDIQNLLKDARVETTSFYLIPPKLLIRINTKNDPLHLLKVAETYGYEGTHDERGVTLNNNLTWFNYFISY